jgi:hypothetical protein
VMEEGSKANCCWSFVKEDSKENEKGKTAGRRGLTKAHYKNQQEKAYY